MAFTNALDPVSGQPQLGDWQFNGLFGVNSATNVTITSSAGEFTLSNADASISTTTGELFLSLTAGGAITLGPDSLSFYLPNTGSSYNFSGDDCDMSITLNKTGIGGNFFLTAASNYNITCANSGSIASDDILSITSQNNMTITSTAGELKAQNAVGMLWLRNSGVYLNRTGSGQLSFGTAGNVDLRAYAGWLHLFSDLGDVSLESSAADAYVSANNNIYVQSGTGTTISAATGNVALNTFGGSLTSTIVGGGIYLDVTGQGGFNVDGGDTIVYNSGAGGQYLSLYSAGNLQCTSPTGTTFTATANDFTANASAGSVVLNSPSVKLPAITSASTSNVVYYDTTSKEVSYAPLPSVELPLVVVSGTSQSISVNTRYIANNAGLTTFTLPATAAVGDIFQIVGATTGLFVIAQNASQSVRLNSSLTTVGVTGQTASTTIGNVLQVICTVADTEFIVMYPNGNFNLT